MSLDDCLAVAHQFHALPNHLAVIAEDLDNPFTWGKLDDLHGSEIQWLRDFFAICEENNVDGATSKRERLDELLEPMVFEEPPLERLPF